MKTLYVSDLDGTLLNPSGHLSEYTVKTLNFLMDKGMNFTVATARSVSSAGGLLDGLNITLPCAMMNGVFLTELSSKRQIYVCRMPVDTAIKVKDAFCECGRPPFVYSFEGEYIECEYSKLKNEYETSFAAARKKLYKRFEKVENYKINGNTVYINGIDSADVMEAVAERIEKIDGVRFSHYLDTYSGDKYFVEVYSEAAGKHNTIQKLKEMYGFDRVVAFGDNGNDVEMLKGADVAVAVGNALPIAANVADISVGSNAEDGVANYLLSLYKSGKLL